MGRPEHRLALWPWLVAGAGACVLAAGFVTVQLRGNHTRIPVTGAKPSAAASFGVASPRAAVPATASAAPNAIAAARAATPEVKPAPAAAAADAPAKPSFDVVRVDADGSAVMAGRAAPGADVTIRDGGQELGHVKANDYGQWVFLPTAKLNTGSRELTLAERMPSGSELRADAAVLLVVPEREPELAVGDATPPIAVLAPEKPASEAAARVLQPPPPIGLGPGARLGLDLVQYDTQGGVVFSGSAPPGAPVRLYVDNHSVGDASADPSGRWSMTPAAAIVAGRHQLRVDELNPSGRVSARVELPFARETEPDKVVAEGRVVVQPGENLWRVARHVYGSGLRFVVIYQANRDQIRNPKLIYPGQAFAVPGAPPPEQSPGASEPPPAPATPHAG